MCHKKAKYSSCSYRDCLFLIKKERGFVISVTCFYFHEQRKGKEKEKEKEKFYGILGKTN